MTSLNDLDAVFGDVHAPCRCMALPTPGTLCQCGNNERVIRAIAGGLIDYKMLPEQRAWCIDQAEWAGEGYYRREELEAMTDQDLAQAVLDMWNEYVKTHF